MAEQDIEDTLFPELSCVCLPEETLKEYGCLCPRYECFLRNLMDGKVTEPLTAEQRAYLVQDADRCGEGSVNPETAAQASDQELGSITFWAMVDYVRSQMG